MTSVVKFPDRAALEKEAATWIAKLDSGTVSQADLRALHRWALTSSHHRSVLEELAASWDMLDILVLARPAETISTGFGRRWQRGIAAVAAGLATVAVVAFGLIRMQSAQELPGIDEVKLIYTTQIGEQRSVTLPDSSRIRINTSSRLQVDYSEERRSIFLHQGEAFFEVVRSNRPFVVTAGKRHVTALGTAFAVRVSDDNVLEVNVTEGTVMVSSGLEAAVSELPLPELRSQIASAGQVVRVGESIDFVQTVEPAVMERQLAWREGMLVFEGDPLESVIAEVSRYTAVEIVMADPSLRDLRLGGYFRTGDTQRLLDTLSSSFGIEVEHIRPGLIYLHQRPR